MNDLSVTVAIHARCEQAVELKAYQHVGHPEYACLQLSVGREDVATAYIDTAVLGATIASLRKAADDFGAMLIERPAETPAKEAAA